MYIVYCLTNPVLEGLCKVGYTKNLNRRLKDLSSTNIPEKFKLEYYINHSINYEKQIQNEIEDLGIERKKEFFKCSPQEIKTIFQKYGEIKEIIPEEIKKDNEINKETVKINNKDRKKCYKSCKCPFCDYKSQKSNVVSHLERQKKCNDDVALNEYTKAIKSLLTSVPSLKRVACEYCQYKYSVNCIDFHKEECKLNPLNNKNKNNENLNSDKSELELEMGNEKPNENAENEKSKLNIELIIEKLNEIIILLKSK